MDQALREAGRDARTLEVEEQERQGKRREAWERGEVEGEERL